ncbi:DMT family transporter [Pseudomonas sp. sp1636]|uniref:DMT family transporter n=1 Tax=Pseudomonas sp. sp1636 TaxID=3036707 RepID=UPI0025A4D462|nr:DMT family transporter [Pseudomonas sp. sp1636]MDM8349533.1 DMT family transporter [Pseudomonas sp. sp1636]
MSKYLAYAAFALLGLIWGSNFIFMKWAAQWISPAQITLLRVLCGFLPILCLALAMRVLSWRHLRHLHHFFVMSLLATAVYYFAFAQGTALLLSSVAGMLSGAIPLFAFIAALLFLRDEPLNLRSVGGTLLGFLGILLIARPWTGLGDVSLVGVAYMLAGSMSVGVSFVYARKFISPLQLPAVALATYQTGLASLVLLLLTDLSGIDRLSQDSRATWGLIAGLGLCGTGLAFILYYVLVQRLGAVVASSVTYLPPLVALAIGVFWVGEAVGPLDIAAMAAILLGVCMMQLGRKPRPKTPEQDEQSGSGGRAGTSSQGRRLKHS